MNSEDYTGLKEQLEEARENAERESEQNREFVSAVAHELRTPVAVIRGSLEALCDGVVSGQEQVREYHRQMLAESIYLQRLVSDLLEFSRLRNSSFSIVREPVGISDVVSDVCRSIKQIAASRGIELICEKCSEPYMVCGDYARLRQMLIVVLDNAVKFTESGGKITVSEKYENGKMYVTVADTGCGIDEDEKDSIFVKFHRTVNNGNQNGTGLGLAIAKEIAARHSAEITVKSRKGEGTAFTFCFSERMTEEDLKKYE